MLCRIHQAGLSNLLVHLERNRYSVPASFANRPVSLRVYPERIVVAAEGQIICEHRRNIHNPGDRKRQLALQEQLSPNRTSKKKNAASLTKT